MSFYGYFARPPREFLIFSDLTDPKLEKHFITYEKYKNLLNTKNFIILDQPVISNKFPTAGYVRDIVIINKKEFAKIVEQNIFLFKDRLGSQITSSALLQAVESGHNVLTDVLQEDELLWGLLLGYGKHNSELYARREEITCNPGCILSKGFETLEEELDYVEEHLEGFTHEHHIDLISLPLFMCDKTDPTTEQLKVKYQKIQENICEIYRSADFFDQVWQKLNN